MSDDRNTFLAKTEAMFAQVEARTTQIVERWFMHLHAQLVLDTVGPENQWPTTDYIAVGRLRMGWTYGLEAPPEVPANRHRIETDWTGDGAITRAKLDAEIAALGVKHAAIYLYNVVGYGHYVHEGYGHGHETFGPRPYVTNFAASDAAEIALARAVAEAPA